MSEYIEPILDAEKISTLNNNPRTFFHESYLNENNDNFEKMNYSSNILFNKTKYILDKQLNHNQENNYINPQLSKQGQGAISSEESNYNPLIYSKPYNPDEYEENQFNEFLKDLMLAESDIEKIKIELVKCVDFNIEDCFRIFEQKENNNVLYPEEIKCGLKLLGVFLSDFELKLFFNRFDLMKKGYINYSNFFDIFIPFSKTYRSLSEKKEPNSCCNCRCPDVFSNSTLSVLKNLFDAIIKYENKFNVMRRGFTTLNLKLKKIFEKIDMGKTGYFSHDDLALYMEKNRIFTDEKELDLLFIRLDKNRNGKIEYKEIYDETHPIYF